LSTTASAPCVDAPELVAAVDTLLAARDSGGIGGVYGEVGAGSNNLMDQAERTDIAAMHNPRGDGVLLSIVYGGDKVFASSTANRAAWLVLNDTVYPVDVPASQAFGLLWAGYPAEVKQAAGIGPNYFSLDDAFGISDFVSYNADSLDEHELFFVEANELCERPTNWDS
jgi:hypothetical protein